MVAKTIIKGKNLKIVKEELVNLLRENDTVEEHKFNIQNIIDQREAINIIKRYEDIIKTSSKELKFIIALFKK